MTKQLQEHKCDLNSISFGSLSLLPDHCKSIQEYHQNNMKMQHS